MTTDRTAALVLGDPDGGGDDALGRAFSALALDLDQAGQDVPVNFRRTVSLVSAVSSRTAVVPWMP